MRNTVQNLHAGLLDACRKSKSTANDQPAFHLGWIEADIAAMFRGSAIEKRRARADLKKYIDNGNRINNAAEQARRENQEFGEALARNAIASAEKGGV